jgi:hypothetical protein
VNLREKGVAILAVFGLRQLGLELVHLLGPRTAAAQLDLAFDHSVVQLSFVALGGARLEWTQSVHPAESSIV